MNLELRSPFAYLEDVSDQVRGECGGNSDRGKHQQENQRSKPRWFR
jgi:hypothetical protein